MAPPTPRTPAAGLRWEPPVGVLRGKFGVLLLMLPKAPRCWGRPVGGLLSESQTLSQTAAVDVCEMRETTFW